jgi:hypothetical protein
VVLLELRLAIAPDLLGNNDVVMGDCFKGLVIISSSTRALVGNSSRPSWPRATDHEGSSSKLDPMYHQPRWCLGGLTNTKKRKLQQIRAKEKKEQELEEQMDEFFNRL